MPPQPEPTDADRPSFAREIEGWLLGSGIAIVVGIGYSLAAWFVLGAADFFSFLILATGAVLAWVAGFKLYRHLMGNR